MSTRCVAMIPRFPTLSVTRLCSTGMGELFLLVSTPIVSVSNLKKWWPERDSNVRANGHHATLNPSTTAADVPSRKKCVLICLHIHAVLSYANQCEN